LCHEGHDASDGAICEVSPNEQVADFVQSDWAPVAELIRRAIDAYLEQRKSEIKNA